MELSVQDRIIARASAADIAAAVDAKPKGEDWFLTLDADNGDSLDVTLDERGAYRVVCAQKGERYVAVSPNDEQLKAVLISYLAGGQEWRQLCRWKIERQSKTARPAARTASSEPPTAAIVAVIASVVLIGVYAAIPDSWRAALPWGNSDFGFVFVVFLPMLVMFIAMLVTKLGAARKAAKWPSVQGRITRSVMSSRVRQFDGEGGDVINAPEIEYVFKTHGQRFVGTRISIGEDTGGANSEATLRRYPVGAAVTVYYNPKDPSDCVLEREIPKDFAKGCLALLGIAGSIGLGLWWAVQYGPAFIGAHLPHAHAGVMLFAIGFGLVPLLMFVASRRVAQRAAGWPTTEGTVLISTTESLERTDEGRQRTVYAPLVEYAYQVEGHEYRSRQIKFNLRIETGAAAAEAMAARYPEGAKVKVRYDPANPGAAALESPGNYGWVLLAVALFCFAVAVKASGVW